MGSKRKGSNSSRASSTKRTSTRKLTKKIDRTE